MIDWFYLIMYSPVYASLFGVGLCLRCLVGDLRFTPMEGEQWKDIANDAIEGQKETH